MDARSETADHSCEFTMVRDSTPIVNQRAAFRDLAAYTSDEVENEPSNGRRDGAPVIEFH